MKKYPSHLILLKGEDRTAEVAKFTYEKGRPFVRVTFRSGGRFGTAHPILLPLKA